MCLDLTKIIINNFSTLDNTIYYICRIPTYYYVLVTSNEINIPNQSN